MKSLTLDQRVDAVTQSLEKLCLLIEALPDPKPAPSQVPYRHLSPALRQAILARLQHSAPLTRTAAAGR